MKTSITVLAVTLGLLSIAAGIAKLALVPQEAAFLSRFGFSNATTIAFGFLQSIGGILMVVPVTRAAAALVCAAGFALSAGLLLLIGNFTFGSVSLVPVLLCMFVAYRSFTGQSSSETEAG